MIRRMTHYGSTAFMLLSLAFTGLLAFVIYNDLVRVYDVTAVSTGDVKAGGVATIEFTYMRPNAVNGRVDSRWLLCDDGTYWNVSAAADTSRASWPTGIDKTIQVYIQIPAQVKPGQVCKYGSTVSFNRLLLPDFMFRNPPIGVPINIIEKAD
jgi:hypothetical protein